MKNLVEDFRLLCLSLGGQEDGNLFKEAANLIGLNFEELMACLPGSLRIEIAVT